MANNHLANPDAELAPLLASVPPAAASMLPDINATRAWLDVNLIAATHRGQEPHLPPKTAYVTKDHTLAVEGGEITVRSYVPASATDGARFPMLFWTHGGGWVIGDLEMDDYYLKILCVELQLVIVSPDYRLAPEYPFPTGINDAFAALKWAKQNTSSFNADLRKGFLVGGPSAGGNLAAVLAHRAKADPEFAQHPLTGQILQYPVTVHPDVVPEEYKENFTAYGQMTDVNMLPTRFMYEFFQLLQGPPADPDVSPLLKPSFDDLPPALVQVCGMDPLRDDGLLYAEKLTKAGVPTRLHVYAGAPHAFHVGFQQTKIAQRFEAELKAGLCWLLAGARGDGRL
ncbi:AB hydrolase superfamily protein B1A11.02 [Trametes pubescens]|uniref:AB hydrolase superfamily protein B1A11.02 n=1 Tax=Trametes pubescens TaxID=154538 RepID=A0A1M2VTR7_TRAPU|nr:AB hydrolase superfamily protein B1A11.02 [Trametes pubescens]